MAYNGGGAGGSGGSGMGGGGGSLRPVVWFVGVGMPTMTGRDCAELVKVWRPRDDVKVVANGMKDGIGRAREEANM